MPIYEYVCSHCDASFEQLMRGSEQPVCPTCGSQQLERLLSVPAAHSAARAMNVPMQSSRGAAT